MIDPRILGLALGRQIRSELDSAEYRKKKESAAAEQRHRELMEKLEDLTHPELAAKRRHEKIVEQLWRDEAPPPFTVYHDPDTGRAFSSSEASVSLKSEYANAWTTAKERYPQLFTVLPGFCEHCLQPMDFLSKNTSICKPCPHCREQSYFLKIGDKPPERMNVFLRIFRIPFLVLEPGGGLIEFVIVMAMATAIALCLFLGPFIALAYWLEWWSLVPAALILAAIVIKENKEQHAVAEHHDRLMRKLKSLLVFERVESPHREGARFDRKEQAKNATNAHDFYFCCNECGENLKVSSGNVNATIHCPTCGSLHGDLEAHVGTRQGIQGFSDSHDVHFLCNNCGQSLVTDRRRIGGIDDSIPCPTCKHNIAIGFLR